MLPAYPDRPMAMTSTLTFFFLPTDWIASWRQELYPRGKICRFSGTLLPSGMCLSYAVLVRRTA